VVTIDLICDKCGRANPPGTEFCLNPECHNFLAWERATQETSDLPPQPPAPGNPTVDHDVPVGNSTPTLEQSAYTDLSCPSCGTTNPNTRRFCSHCGYQFPQNDSNLYAGDGYVTPSNEVAARDRAARKEYQRLLPLHYRWRRVIIVVLLVVLGLVAGLAFGRDPVGTAKGGWYSLTRKYEWVQGVSATVEPATASADKSDPAALVDGTENPWTMKWAPRSVSDCAAPEGTGTIVLTLAVPTRIRLLQIAPL
jgi:predicted nucleic acid-binding Zn ribbon protein